MNTNDLLGSLKRHILYPSSSIKFSDPDFVKMMNEQMLWAIQTEFVAMNEDYFVSKVDVPLTANTSKYICPRMATCWSFDQIMYVDGDGTEVLLPRWSYKMENVNPDTAERPYGIILEDAYIKTNPYISSSPVGSLRFYFRKILNQLTEVGNCGTVISIIDNSLYWDCLLNTLPVGYTTGVDVINGINPFEVLSTAQIPSVAGTTVSLLKTSFERPPVSGDIVAPTGYTSTPHLPEEWHSIISVCTAVSILASNGNQMQYALKKGERDEMIAQLRRVNSRRVNSSPKRIVDRRYQLNAMRWKGRVW